MNKWFNEIEKYSHRDQLSFNYILWKTGIKITATETDLAKGYDSMYTTASDNNWIRLKYTYPGTKTITATDSIKIP